MGERINVGVCTTAAQAHFSNEVVERHSLTLKTMVSRLHRDQPGAGAQELPDQECLANNAMSAHNGAAPFHLVCGSTTRPPAALTDRLAALSNGEVAGDEAIRLHLELLHGARAAHTQAEADASLRRALARNATNAPHRDWAVGHGVYYWNEGLTPRRGALHGPAFFTDMAADKRSSRIQHGHAWTTRHVSELRLAGEDRPKPTAGPVT